MNFCLTDTRFLLVRGGWGFLLEREMFWILLSISWCFGFGFFVVSLCRRHSRSHLSWVSVRWGSCVCLLFDRRCRSCEWLSSCWHPLQLLKKEDFVNLNKFLWYNLSYKTIIKYKITFLEKSIFKLNFYKKEYIYLKIFKMFITKFEIKDIYIYNYKFIIIIFSD